MQEYVFVLYKGAFGAVDMKYHRNGKLVENKMSSISNSVNKNRKRVYDFFIESRFNLFSFKM